MKNKMILLVALFVATFSGVIKAEIPESLPFYSKASLRAWLLEQVQSGTVDFFGDSILDSPDSVAYLRAYGDSAGQILRDLSFQVPYFPVANTTDTVHVFGYLSDEMGYALFQGYAKFVPQETDAGGFVIPSDTNLMFRMPDEVPVRFDGLQRARILYRSEDGRRRWSENLEVYNQRVWLPVDYLGENGQLILTFEVENNFGDEWEEERAYSLSTGESSGATVSGEINLGLENYIEVSDKGHDPSQALHVHMTATDQNFDGEIEAPVVRLHLDDEQAVVLFVSIIVGDRGSADKVWPDSMWYREIGSEFDTEIIPVSHPRMGNVPYFRINILPPGDYMITPEFEILNEDPTPPWEDHGEKG